MRKQVIFVILTIMICLSCILVNCTTYTEYRGLRVDDKIPRYQYKKVSNLEETNAVNFLADALRVKPSDINLTSDSLTAAKETWSLSDLFEEKFVFLSAPKRCKMKKD